MMPRLCGRANAGSAGSAQMNTQASGWSFNMQLTIF
jgi:hypothetical protein